MKPKIDYLEKLHSWEKAIEDLKYRQNHFTCPHCGKEYPKEIAVINDEITDSKYVGSTVRGRNAIHKFQDSHYQVRFCPSCAKKRSRVRFWLSKFIWIICLLILTVFFTYCALVLKGETNILGSLLSSFLMSYLISIVFVGIPLSWLFKWLYFDFDLEKAKKGNAILSIFEFITVHQKSPIVL